MAIDLIAYAYAAAVATGGVIGYIKKGSLVSGLMGLAFGTIMGYGAYQTTQNPNNYGLSLAVSGALTGVMGYRFMNSGKLMPAGVVALLSLAMVIRYGLRATGITPVKQN